MAEEKKPTTEEINKSVRSLRINTAVILGAIWGGVFGYEKFASSMIDEQLFELVSLGLVIAAILTIAVLVYGLMMAHILVHAPRGTEIQAFVQGVAPPTRSP